MGHREKDGFVQQCVATSMTTQMGATLNLMLTSVSELSTARPLSSPGSRTVAGDVFEETTTGRRFVDGASVKVYSDALYYAEPVAFTRSDAAGHYVLCELPQGRISSLIAEKQDYNFSIVSVEAGTNAMIDIELRRQ